MNYKELIDKIRIVETGLLEDNAKECADVCESAAAAIETILEERDAAVKLRDTAINEIRGVCKFCKHGPPSYRKTICYDCCDDMHNWLWRGLQEGEPHGE